MQVFYIFYYSKDGKKKDEHFNFGSSDPRLKGVRYRKVAQRVPLFCLLGTSVVQYHILVQVSSPGPAGKLLSPYQKPVRLFLQLIRNHSIEGSWVLDATGGSGRNLCSFPLFRLIASSYNIIETCHIYFIAYFIFSVQEQLL